MSIGSKIKKEVRRHPRLYALGASGLALSAALALSVGPSLGAFTAAVGAGVSQQAGTLTEEVDSSCVAQASDSFAASCGTSEVTSYATPGTGGSTTFTVEDTGTLNPTNDSGFAWTLTPAACSGSNSTICDDTFATVQLDEWSASADAFAPDGCLYGPVDSAGTGCATPTSSAQGSLEGLGAAGTISLPLTPADTGEAWYHGSPAQFIVTTELSPDASSSDEGQTATVDLSWTMSA